MTPQERKQMPIYSGCIRYFRRALGEISKTSLAGNIQHHPDKPLYWDMSKSTDELDAQMRHMSEAGKVDTDGQLHSSKNAWRANAYLERELIYREDFNIPSNQDVDYQEVIKYTKEKAEKKNFKTLSHEEIWKETLQATKDIKNGDVYENI